MIVLGLTGSIAMGKSATAQKFRDIGIPVFDSDACVHALYEGEAVERIEKLFPGTTDGATVDRAALAQRVLTDSEALGKLESAIHPMVRRKESEFLDRCRAENRDLVVLDIPLLYETGGHKRVDGVIVVTASESEQERRVLARPGMTVEKFEAILARQVPDAVKRKRADFVIDTSNGHDSTRRAVSRIVETIRSGVWKPAPPTGE